MMYTNFVYTERLYENDTFFSLMRNLSSFCIPSWNSIFYGYNVFSISGNVHTHTLSIFSLHVKKRASSGWPHIISSKSQSKALTTTAIFNNNKMR